MSSFTDYEEISIDSLVAEKIKGQKKGETNDVCSPRGNEDVARTSTRELVNEADVKNQAIEGDIAIDHVPHTMLTYRQKWLMVALLTSAGFWSSLGSPIYYPALKQLEKQFNVNEELVNITVVVYLLFQGIAPMVSGGIADTIGRRPVILFGMLVYVVASIALACADSYGVVVFLRCLQSAGISPIIAINSGVAGDFTTKSERGTFIGAVSGLTLMGQAFGSLIGAALTAAYGWRSIFWFLTIGCGSCMIILIFLLPETKRTIVGNLSIEPESFLNKSPVIYIPKVRRQLRIDDPYVESLDKTKVKFEVISALKIIFLPEIILFLLPIGFQFALWTLSLTSLSSRLAEEPYGYSLTIIGICYLPSGIGGVLGSLVTGRIVDLYYKRSIRKFNQSKKNGDIPASSQFNIVKNRMLSMFPQSFTAVASYTIFGWSLDRGWHIAAVLIFSFISTFCSMSALSTSNTLLVDLYPAKSSTSSSCVNFIRCILAAIFMASFSKMVKTLTIGGTFTFISGLVFLFNMLSLIPMRYAMVWIQRRAEKNQNEKSDIKNQEV